MSPTAENPFLLVSKFSVFTEIFSPLSALSPNQSGPSCLFNPKKKGFIAINRFDFFSFKMH